MSEPGFARVCHLDEHRPGSKRWWVEHDTSDAQSHLSAQIPGLKRHAAIVRVPVAWESRGEHRFARRNYPGASADHTRAIELAPNRASGWAARGNARKASGDLRGASDDYSRALELAPTRAAVWNWRGLTREALGDLQGARQDFSMALEAKGFKKEKTRRGRHFHGLRL